MDIFNALQLTGLIKIILIGISIGIGVACFRYTKSFLLWIKGGIENGDGVLQNKDLQMAMFTLMCWFILITYAGWNVIWDTTIVTLVFGVTAALYGIKNIGQSYVEGKKNGQNGQNGYDKNNSDDLG